MRQRAGHHLEMDDGGELASIELIEELVRLPFFVGGCQQESFTERRAIRISGELLAEPSSGGLPAQDAAPKCRFSVTLGRINCDWLAVRSLLALLALLTFPPPQVIIFCMTFLRFLMLVSLVAWIGGLIFLPVVAQTAFSVLPTRRLAGLVVRHIGTSGGLPTIRRTGGPLRHFAGEQRRSVNERSFISL